MNRRLGFALAAISATLLLAPLLLARAQPPAERGFQGWTFVGERVAVGRGTAHSWVQVDGNGTPIAMGITFSEAALFGLPTAVTEWVLPLPRQVAVPPYDHATIDWRPRGHIPPGIYDRPHFDYHFYLITRAQRDQITVRGVNLERVMEPPGSEFIPEGYVPEPTGEPRMGRHWANAAAHEFHGQPFTRTFIYGYYDGRLAFVEPMVTREFLLGRPNLSEAIQVPAAYHREGYYPTSYTVRYLPQTREYTVSLDGLTFRPGAAE